MTEIDQGCGSKTGASFEAFRRAYLLARTRDDHSLQSPYLEWARLAFCDFYTKESEKDLDEFLKDVAEMTSDLVGSYKKKYLRPKCKKLRRKKAFTKRLQSTCQTLDQKHIFHRNCRLRGLHDISLQVEILRIFIEYLSDEKIWPGSDKMIFAEETTQYLPSWTPGYIVLGQLQLESDQIDRAIETGERAFAIKGGCPSTDRLLYRAHMAKGKAASSTKNGVAIYHLKDRFCPKPFETVVIGGDGFCYLCDCAAWLPYDVGNLMSDATVDSIWNSEAAFEIRHSILTGNFEYCSRILCPFIISNKLPLKKEVEDSLMQRYIMNNTTKLKEGPRVVQLSYDPTCNLACPSCRKEEILASPSERENFENVKERVIMPLLRQVKGALHMAGWGDPFASAHYRSILAELNKSEYPDLRLNITTNGLLLSPKMWDKLKGLRDFIDWLYISIDAAKPETHEKLRSPGKWSRLMSNLTFLAELHVS